MAFPSIPTGGRVLTSTQADTTATRTFPSLSSLTKNSGDLLIALIFGYQSDNTSPAGAFTSWGGGFTEFFDWSTTTSLAIAGAYKFSDGTETGTFTCAESANITGHAVMILLSISGAHASAIPEAGGYANGTNAAGNPGSLTPSWGALDNLYIAATGCGETSTAGSFTGVTGDSTNYASAVDTGISADVLGGLNGRIGFRQIAGSPEDPGTMAADTTNARWGSITIAIRPAAKLVNISDTGVTNTDSILKVTRKVISDTLTFSDSILKLSSRVVSDTGVTNTDTLLKVARKVLSDTGVTPSDSLSLVSELTYARIATDTGTTITETLVTRRARLATDTGVTPGESLVRLLLAARPPTDTGVTQTDSLVPCSNRPVTDTGTTNTDSLLKVARKVITDTGVSLSDVLGPRIYHYLSDTGVSGSGLINVTLVGTALHSDADATSYTYASAAYSNSRLYVCFVNSSIASGTAPTCTGITGGGLTWVEHGSTPGVVYSGVGSAVRRIQVFRALVTSGATTGALTISYDGTSTGCHAVVAEVTGGDTSGTNGSGGIAQSIGAFDNASVTSLSISMAALGAANRPLAFFSHRATEATTNEGGYTELDDGTGAAPSTGTCLEWNPTVAEASPSASWTTGSNTGGIAVELVAGGLSDSIISLRNRALSDTGVTNTDSLVKFASKFLTDTGVNLTDVLASRIYHYLSDTGVTPSDSLVAVFTPGFTLYDRTATDTGVTNTDTLVKFTTKLISDTLTFSDSLTKFVTWSRTTSDTGVTNTDSLLTLRVHVLSDTLTFSDSLTKVALIVRTISDTGVTLTDVLAERLYHYLSDTLTFSDSLSTTRKPTISDTGLTQTDSLLTLRSRVLSDTLTFSDILAKGRINTISDTGVTPSDSITKFASKLISDSITISESLAIYRLRVITVTDTGVTNTDSITKAASKFITDTGVNFTDVLAERIYHYLTDTLTFSDSLVRVALFHFTLSDTGVTQTDTLLTLRTKLLTDTGVTNTDSLVTLRVRSLSDTSVTQTDSIARTIVRSGLRDTGCLQSVTNLVTNSSFETNLSDWNVISGTVATRVNTESFYGSWSQKIDTTAVNQGATFSTAVNSLSPGDVIVVSAWFKATAGTLMGLGGSNRTNEQAPLGNLSPFTWFASGSWERIQAPFTITGATARRALLTFGSREPGAATCYMDGVQCEITSTGNSIAGTYVGTTGSVVTIDDADSLVKAASKVLSDTGVTNTDSLTKYASKFITDTGISLTDVLAERISHYLTDTGITQSDSLVRAAAFHFFSSDTGVTQTDTLLTLIVRQLSDTLTFTDTLSTSGALLLSDTGVTQSDSLTTLRLRVLTDTLTFSDSLASRTSASRTATDTGITSSDSLTKYASKFINDTITFSDNLGIYRLRIISVTDTGVTNTDTLVKYASKFISDTGVNLTDVLAERISHYNVDTGVAQSDSLIRNALFLLFASDTGIASSDTLLTTRVHVLSDTFTFTDSLTKYASKVLSDTLTFSDSLRTRRYRVLTDTLAFSDSLSRVFTPGFTGYQRTITDTGITSTDSISRSISRTLSTTGLAQSDQLSAGQVQNLTDTGLVQTDSLTFNIHRVLTDTLTFSDSIGHAARLYRTLTETLPQSDYITKIAYHKLYILTAYMYPRYTASVERHYKYSVHGTWSTLKTNIFKAYYVREWWKKWKS